MQLKQLVYFTAIVEQGSFSRAAGKLYLAQSSLSQSIQALEQELGFSLLKRGRSGIAPTEMGELVYDQVKDLLTQVEQMTEGWKQTYRTCSALTGTVRIACVPGAHPILVHLVLERIHEFCPNIRFKISEARNTLLLPWLAQGQVDVILSDYLEEERQEAAAFAQAHELELTELRRDAYKIAAGNTRPLAEQEFLRAEDAAGLSLACYSGGDAAADRYFERFFDPAISMEYNSIEKMVQAARDGPGVSILPELTIRSSYPDTLRFLTVEGFCVPFVHIAGVRRGDAGSKELEITLQTLARVFRKLE